MTSTPPRTRPDPHPPGTPGAGSPDTGSSDGGKDRPGRESDGVPPSDAPAPPVGLFALLLVAALLTLSLPLPWQAASLAFTAAAVVVGVRVLLAARRSRRGGLLVPLAAAGTAMSLLLSLSVVSALAFYDIALDRQTCLQRALTTSANQACEQQFRDAVQSRVDGVVERVLRR